MEHNILLCVDRDGTLIYDDHYFLGKDNYWKSKVKILPKIVEGMKLLDKTFPNCICRFILSNQPGVAIQDFKRLTLKRANDVCKEVALIFKRKGAFFDGCIICPHVSLDYVKKHPEYNFDKKYVQKECNCFKPNIGMIEDALAKKKLDKKNTYIYVIGDRESDILTALNAKGVGILVPFEKNLEELEKVKDLKNKYPKQVFIAKDFLGAIQCVIDKERE
ncbi:hypothetical protein COU53_03575 [Candidatus Pacearchaeota archaeon CG10_big_fil_rev_8_21_14_0_10_30_48]|nr:MAG: hypothetical protein COU53_03575 [Candidatus Pacearchaeota archaeon CG10_big_fil_rev_8_21_14_0_10_30_48]